MKGHNFTISLVAVDQVKNSVSANIHGSLISALGGLGESQTNQRIGKECTNLTYTIFSPSKSAHLILYPIGPCKNASLSHKRVTIEFLPCKCTTGFQPSNTDDTKCECVCDIRLRPYITEYDYRTKTLTRKGSFWITNVSSSYLIYPYCPLDYCKPSTSRIKINFETPNGINLQCADNRVGTLCGMCQHGFMLSLGSSRCIQCSAHWYNTTAAVVFVTIVVGIILVAIVLALNFTVAVGTLNGIIFYANIIGANSNIFFLYSTQNFLTVFLNWLNLEIGFDCCLYKGMDAHWKTLIQLAFPVYLIVLVLMVIVISEHSIKFAQLIGRMNPVATLATLILLSYTKLLRSIIAALSFAILKFPDGSSKVVWLPDASVEYLKGKHIILFTVSILILLPGIAFTLILFSWQWLLRYQNKAIFKWVRYNKLKLFLEPYHAPYELQYRYWTGLLLLIRAAVYVIISVMNVSNDPGVNLLAIAISVLLLIFIILKAARGRIYKNWPVQTLEEICYANMIIFCLTRLFVLESSNEQGQIIAAYISGTITFMLFVAVFGYHFYTKLLSKIVNKLREVLTDRIPDNNMVASGHGDGAQIAPPLPTCSVIDPVPREEEPSLTATTEDRLTREQHPTTSNVQQRNERQEEKARRPSSSSSSGSADSITWLLADDEESTTDVSHRRY